MQILRDWLAQELISQKKIDEDSTLDVTSITLQSGSKWTRIEALATRLRCRKPYMYWNICIDLDKEEIYWPTTTCYNL